jgi:hypothetical protein
MDFDIGNILYVLITLVAIVIGLLGRKKKPARTAEGSEQKDSSPSFMENLEKAFNMQREEQGAKEESRLFEDRDVEEPVSAADESAYSSSIMEEYEKTMRGMDETETDRILAGEELLTEQLEVLDLDQEEGTDYFEIIKDFDAGTAVVYSAIINRVEY